MTQISARDNMKDKIEEKKKHYDRHAIVFDFDGTIAEHAEYPEIGKPIEKTVKKIKELKDKGYEIIISSCRFSEDMNTKEDIQAQFKQVKEWLKDNKVPFDKLWEHSKPAGLAYVDDRGINVDDIEDLDEDYLHSLKLSSRDKNGEA